MSITYRPAKKSDLPEIREFSIRMMVEKFGHLYSQEDLDAHLEEAYSESYYKEAFKNSKFLLAMDGNMLVGYAMWGALGLPVKNPLEPCGEIQRLYVDSNCRGYGIGRLLMDGMMEDMADKAAIYLNVFSENKGAQRFYERWGFSKYGEYKYRVGNHADHEFIYQFIR